MKCEKWTSQHDECGRKKKFEPSQESNPWPPKHGEGTLFTELRHH